MKIYFTVLITLLSINAFCQNQLDTIKQNTRDTSEKKLPAKVDHAEPIYIDLMRDLGARKGEAEVNVGLGRNNNRNYNEYYGFVEYEWAVANRLGMEVEVPFSFNQPSTRADQTLSLPGNKVEGIKLATQYTFLVNENKKLSMAVAYVHEFELNTFKQLKNHGSVFTGMRMNPVFIAAKNFNNFNTLLYTGPVFNQHYSGHKMETGGTINASLMYVIPNTKNFVGIENNIDITKDSFQYYLRPQVKVAIKHNLMIGLVAGIPISNQKSGGDIMTRVIWEL